MNREIYQRIRSSLDYCKYTAADRPKREVSQFVYVVECEGYVKVGIAADVTLRIYGMQTGNPFPIKLLKAWKHNNPGDLEDKLHALLNAYRVRGEWFKIPPSILSKFMAIGDISDLCNVEEFVSACDVSKSN